MGRYIPILLALLFLTGCEGEQASTAASTPTPPPALAAAETVSTLELEVGSDAPAFRLELVRTGEPGELQVDIYQGKGANGPIQQFMEWAPDCQLTELTAEDVNFDGYTDFHFLVNTGTQGEEYSAYYVWDPAGGQFVPDPYGLNDILNGRFYPLHREVISVTQGGERWTYYQYEDGGLIQTGQQEAEADHSDWRIKVNNENILRIRAECRGEPRGDFPESDIGLTLTVYLEGEENQPLQIIETGTMKWNERFRLAVQDMDFDGNMDFYYTYSEGLHDNGVRCFYIWDGETGIFLPDPYGLNSLMNAGIDEESQAVTEYERGTDWDEERYYRYDPDTGELRLCRSLYYGGWGEGGEMAVTDYRRGEALLVYSAKSEELFSGPGYEEFCRWRDLDYHGE